MDWLRDNFERIEGRAPGEPAPPAPQQLAGPIRGTETRSYSVRTAYSLTAGQESTVKGIWQRAGAAYAQLLRESDLEVLETLIGYAYGHACQRGHKFTPSSVAVHFCQDDLFGMFPKMASRTTRAKVLARLEHVGAIKHRAQIIGGKRGRYCTGTVCAVRLANFQQHLPKASTPGRAPSFVLGDLSKHYRDFWGDLDEGNTAYERKLVKSGHTQERTKDSVERVNVLLNIALKPPTEQPSLSVYVHSGVYCVLDVFYCEKQDRAKLINSLAGYLCTVLGDHTGSRNFYRWIMWRLLDARAAEGEQAALELGRQVAAHLNACYQDALELSGFNAGKQLAGRLKRGDMSPYERLKRAEESVTDFYKPSGHRPL